MLKQEAVIREVLCQSLYEYDIIDQSIRIFLKDVTEYLRPVLETDPLRCRLDMTLLTNPIDTFSDCEICCWSIISYS